MKRLFGSVAVLLSAACATSSGPVSSSTAATPAAAASAQATPVPAAGPTSTSAPRSWDSRCVPRFSSRR